jgi:hypothetical protein
MAIETITSTRDVIPFAQDMQLDLLEYKFEERLEKAEGALLLLAHLAVVMELEEGSQLVVSRQAFDRPYQESVLQRRLIHFPDLTVEGTFKDFSYVSIGDIRKIPINTICMSLEDAVIYPDKDQLPTGDVLHVPVLSISEHFHL